MTSRRPRHIRCFVGDSPTDIGPKWCAFIVVKQDVSQSQPTLTHLRDQPSVKLGDVELDIGKRAETLALDHQSLFRGPRMLEMVVAYKLGRWQAAGDAGGFTT